MCSFTKVFDTEEMMADLTLDDGEQNLEEEAREMLKSWDREDLMKEISDQLKQRDEDNKTIDFYDGVSPFSTIAEGMEPLVGSKKGKVRIKILETNPSGKEIQASDTILFDRAGYLEYQAQPFDCSALDGKPSKLNLMDGPIIPGLLQALVSLREGERANIFIDSSMAFKNLGCPPTIPPDADLFYNVKIYKVWKVSLLNEIYYDEKIALNGKYDDQQIIAAMEEHKQIANTLLNDGQFKDALVRYKAAIGYLDDMFLPDYYQKCEKVRDIMISLLLNAAIAYNKLNMYKSASRISKRALSIDPNNLKSYYQLAKARIGLSDYSGALKWIELASKKFKDTKCFDHLRVELNFQKQDERKKRDEIERSMARCFKLSEK